MKDDLKDDLIGFCDFLDKIISQIAPESFIKAFVIDYMNDHEMDICYPLTLVFPSRNISISITPEDLHEVEPVEPVAAAKQVTEKVPFQSRLCSAISATGSYGCAVAEINAGKRVARTGWNGNGMYIFKFSPVHHGMEELTIHDREPGTTKPLLPFIMMKTADDMYVPWLASQTDMLANDWMVVG